VRSMRKQRAKPRGTSQSLAQLNRRKSEMERTC
jgi:hypothetical protein